MKSELDSMMKQVDTAGRYQLLLFLLFATVVGIQSLQVMSPTYTYIKPHFICNGEECDDTDYNCENYNISISPQFKYKNIVTQLGLYCDRDKFISILTSIGFLGSALGGSSISYLGDRHGRKIAFIISWSIAVIGFIGIYFSDQVWTMVAFTFIMGFGQIGSYVMVPVMLNEVCSTKLRQRYTLGVLVSWSLVEMLTAVLYYYIEDWRNVQLYFIVIPAIVTLLLSFFIVETPKYYFCKGLDEELLVALNKIANVNRMTQMDTLSFQLEKVDEKDQPRYSFKHLFTFRSLRMPSVGFMLISYSLHLIYYGAQYGLKDISTGDMLYVMGIVVGVGEFITYTIMAFTIQYLKRKVSLIVSFTVSLACCYLFLVFGFGQYNVECHMCWKESLTILFAFGIRVFNTVGFSLQALCANEFYPTPIRSLGTGFLFSVGIIGSFSSPYVIQAADILHMNPFVLIGSISTLGLLGTKLIRETLNRPLQDAVYECKSRRSSINYE